MHIKPLIALFPHNQVMSGGRARASPLHHSEDEDSRMRDASDGEGVQHGKSDAGSGGGSDAGSGCGSRDGSGDESGDGSEGGDGDQTKKKRKRGSDAGSGDGSDDGSDKEEGVQTKKKTRVVQKLGIGRGKGGVVRGRGKPERGRGRGKPERGKGGGGGGKHKDFEFSDCEFYEGGRVMRYFSGKPPVEALLEGFYGGTVNPNPQSIHPSTLNFVIHPSHTPSLPTQPSPTHL